MLSFFRKIRKSLVEARNARNYLPYAFGEIVLIVIGILIALQINNWNTNLKDRRQELLILQEMSAQLELDLADMEVNIWAHEQNIRSCAIILEHMKSNLPYHDSLTRHFAHAYLMTSFNSTTSAYESLKDIGVNLISNPKLRNDIVQLYDNRYPLLKSHESDLRARYNYQFNQVLNTRIGSAFDLDYANRDSIGYMKPIDFESLSADQEMLYWLESNKNYNENIYLRYRYYPIYKRAKVLKDDIDKEIEERSD